MTKRTSAVCVMSLAGALGIEQATAAHDEIVAYLNPYVSSGNFSGSILVVESGKVLFRDSYGCADTAKGAPNRVDTKYHVASLSMQFTAATAMRLVQRGKLSLATRVSELVADVPNGQKITVQELLQENSGLPDANDLPGYDDLLNAHQTPESLVQFIRGRSPVREPGGPTQDEEHSAYNLLALIVERVTGLPFKEAVRREVFAPLGMNDSGVDDDSPITGHVARGHVENGSTALRAAPLIHWSAKTGNGSAYSTVDDEHRWLEGFLGNKFLSGSNRQMMLDWGDGYGWTRIDPPRFKEPIYVMNGQSPGFASFIIYMPRLRAEIIILSNFQIPVPKMIGYDLAALLEGGEYHRLELRASPLTPDEVSQVVGRFRFGSDFYRPNGTLEIVSGAGGLTLRWPDWGPDSPVLVVDGHHFIDRHYWTRFSVADDLNGRATQLTFGRFTGARTADNRPATAH